MRAFHFLKSDRMTQYEPRIPVTVGQTLTVDPDRLKLCEFGLHGSVLAIDALTYAPGSTVCLVEIDGRILTGEDKLCGSERTVLAMADASEELRSFARWCALQVINQWDAPKTVRRWLETGDESIRAAAHASAYDYASAYTSAAAAAHTSASAAAYTSAAAAADAAASASAAAYASASAAAYTSAAAAADAAASASAAAYNSAAAAAAASAAAAAAARAKQNIELETRLMRLLESA